MDENVTEFEFKASNNEEYEVDGIRDSAVYAKKSEVGHLPGLGLSGAASASTLPPLLGSGDDKNKLLGLQCLNFKSKTEARRVMRNLATARRSYLASSI